MVIRNKKSIVSLFLAMLMLLSILLIADSKIANAATSTFNTTDDNWMWGTTVMDPASTTMNVSSANGKQSYLKFTVGGAGTITNAVLNVKCVTGGTATIGAYAGTGTNWTESTLSYTNAPAVGALLESKNITFVAGTVYSFDVTPLITGNGTYSIVLKATAGAEVVFSTKEGTGIPNVVTSNGTTPPPTNTFNTSDDNWMWGTTVMDPASTTMNVSSSAGKQSYLKFTVGGAGTITNAVLNVKCVTGGTATIGAYAGTGTNWTESTLSYTNAPAVGSLLESKNITFVAGTMYSFDVTPLITSNGTYSIVLKGTAGAEVVFSTKEGTGIPNVVTNGGATQTPDGPSLTGYTLLRDYSFGTSRNVNSLTSLSNSFNSYGIAGTTVINNEWQRYQTINDTNHHLTSTTLELTATPNLGGVYAGGISSGQIATKETFYPSDGKTYIFQLRAKIPKKTGAWPAFWMYSPGGTGSTSSEIDIHEFFDTPTQNTYDYTGYDHGTGVGTDYYSIMTNQWVWHPGWDFAPDYHLYTLIWKEGDIQKWVDGTQVKGTNFTWYGPAPQVIINLAMGGSVNNDPVASSFPAVYSLDYFRVYVK